MDKNVDWDLYDFWLGSEKEKNRNSINANIINGIIQGLDENPAYQRDAMRNGEIQPIIALRTDTRKCKVTIIPGDDMFIGDLICVFGEHWLCMELYTDEYGIKYGEIWMCNHIFSFQNKSPKIFKKYAIVDDGSYSKGADKTIIITNNSFTCYMSLDNESLNLHVDKRLALGIVLDSAGRQILEVGKIGWLDLKSRNFGKGSHLLMFRLENDVYNTEHDDLSEQICNFISANERENETNHKKGYLAIEGRGEIRLGTTRTYSVFGVDEKGNRADIDGVLLEWHTLNPLQKVEINYNGNSCSVKIPLIEELIGEEFEICCEDTSGSFQAAIKSLEVISIG